jgi:alginate O-acetyltransferase complex protein AlgJ
MTQETIEKKQEEPRRPAPARVFSVAAVIFFLLPVVAYLGGMRSKAIENRPLQKFPHLSVSWSTFDDFGAWFADHVPFRPRAVEIRRDISRNIFDENPPSGGAPIEAIPNANGGAAGTPAAKGPALGEAPAKPVLKSQENYLQLPPLPPEPAAPSTSEVVGGKNGWLFLTSEFLKECNPGQPRAQVIAGLQRLNSILTASGRKFALTLAPDKSTVEPQYLPGSYPYQDCAPKAKDETYALLAGAGLPGYVDSRALILDRQAKEKRDYYLRKDTHWNGVGISAVTQELARKLDPAAVTQVHSGEGVLPYTGDLTTLMGEPKTEDGLFANIDRPGVKVTQAPGSPLAGVRSAATSTTSTGAHLYDGHVFMVGDSFSDGVIPQLSPFVTSLTWMHNGDVRIAPQTTVEQIKASNAVVLVWNERYFADPAYGVLWSPQFLDRLEQSLRG